MPELQTVVLAALDESKGNARGYELMSRLKMLDYTYFRPGRGEKTNRQQAMDFLERSVELSPGDPALISYRARLHTTCCRRSARSYYAEEYAEDAIRRHPSHDWSYTFILAQTFQLQMVYDRSLEILVDLANNHPNILLIHGET